MRSDLPRATASLLTAAFLCCAIFGAAQPPTREDEKKVRDPGRSYTDEDLERYREQRNREAEGAGVDESLAGVGEVPAVAGAAGAKKSGPRISVLLQERNDKLPAEARERAQAIAERIIIFYGVPIESPGPLVIPLRYFDKIEGYNDYLVRKSLERVGAIGFFLRTEGEIIVSNQESFFVILIHEINHFIVDKILQKAPQWLNEGLSEYFETAQLSGERGLSVSVPGSSGRLRRWIDEGRKPDLRDMLGMSNWSWYDHDTQKGWVARAVSWSIVHFIMSRPEGHAMLLGFMSKLRERHGFYAYDAIDRSYRGGVRAFERDWLQYVDAQVPEPGNGK